MNAILPDTALDVPLTETFATSKTVLPDFLCSQRSAFADFERLQMLGNHLDGGSSRVFCFHPHVAPNKVLKLTSCPATRELLGRLLEWNGVRSYPNLPSVERSLGLCAVDKDGIEYSGFVLERLHRPRTECQRAMVAYLVERVQDALQHATATTDAYFHWETSWAAIDLLASENPYGLRPALRLIGDVIMSRRGFLDLDTPGNLLFKQDGTLVLADPVAVSYSPRFA